MSITTIMRYLLTGQWSERPPIQAEARSIPKAQSATHSNVIRPRTTPTSPMQQYGCIPADQGAHGLGVVGQVGSTSPPWRPQEPHLDPWALVWHRLDAIERRLDRIDRVLAPRVMPSGRTVHIPVTGGASDNAGNTSDSEVI